MISDWAQIPQRVQTPQLSLRALCVICASAAKRPSKAFQSTQDGEQGTDKLVLQANRESNCTYLWRRIPVDDTVRPDIQ